MEPHTGLSLVSEGHQVGNLNHTKVIDDVYSKFFAFAARTLRISRQLNISMGRGDSDAASSWGEALKQYERSKRESRPSTSASTSSQQPQQTVPQRPAPFFQHDPASRSARRPSLVLLWAWAA